MNVADSSSPEDPGKVFYIGQHKTLRTEPLSTDLIFASRDLGYDFLTSHIASSTFHDKIERLVSNHFSAVKNSDGASSIPLPSVPAFTPEDTYITPDDGNISLVAIVSTWINPGSKDPVIRHVSRQVLSAELAYAAFCGISNILILGPLPDSDVVQYARAIHEGLGLGPYLTLHILLPVAGELEQDLGHWKHLAELASSPEDDVSEEHDELCGAWDSWNTIRTMCNYSNKLSLGKTATVLLLRSSFLYVVLHNRTLPIAKSAN